MPLTCQLNPNNRIDELLDQWRAIGAQLEYTVVRPELGVQAQTSQLIMAFTQIRVKQARVAAFTRRNQLPVTE